MERIKDIVQRHAAATACYEIAFWLRGSCRKNDIVSVYDSGSRMISPGLREDIDPLELWADDFDILGEDEYYALFPWMADFIELFGDANAKVLVIWLTRLSYEILSNPEIMPVREFRLNDLGKYHDYYVVRQVRDNAQPRQDDWFDDEEYSSQDDDYGTMNSPAEKYIVRSGTKDQLDKLFARESILIPANTLGSSVELEGADAWWMEETPLEHYGRDDAYVLLIVLA